MLENFQTNLHERYSKYERKNCMVEDGRILHDDETIGECFNSYFVNVSDTLDLPKEAISAHEDVNHEDLVLQAINKYQHHPSI